MFVHRHYRDRMTVDHGDIPHSGYALYEYLVSNGTVVDATKQSHEGRVESHFASSWMEEFFDKQDPYLWNEILRSIPDPGTGCDISELQVKVIYKIC